MAAAPKLVPVLGQVRRGSSRQAAGAPVMTSVSCEQTSQTGTVWVGNVPVPPWTGDIDGLPKVLVIGRLISGVWIRLSGRIGWTGRGDADDAAWTGFALERLQPRLGPIGASVVTTWLQALVHVALIFVVGGVTDCRVPADQIPFYLVALFVLPIPVRMALTWLYNRSGRRVPIFGLAHAGLGVATGVALIPADDPVWVYAAFAALAAVILFATRGMLGYETAARSIRAGGEVAVTA